MTQDDIIRMAREADLLVTTPIPDDSVFVADLVRFADLIAAAEREACALLCDDLVRSYWNSTGDEDEPYAYDCAAAIRAREGKK